MPKLIDDTRGWGGAPFAGMAIGEVRTVQLATRSKEPPKLSPSDPTSMEPKTITRSNKSFAEDWADSTNDELAGRGVGHLRWLFVDGPNMPPRLVDTRYVTNAHARKLAA